MSAILTPDEIEAAKRVINNHSIIENCTKALREAENKMKLLKKCREQYLSKPGANWDVGMSWEPSLVLEPRNDRYGSREITIRVKVPYSVVEQQIVYEMEDLRRKIIAAGGMA